LKTLDQSDDLYNEEEPLITTKWNQLKRDDWDEILPKLTLEVAEWDLWDIFDRCALPRRCEFYQKLDEHRNGEDALVNEVKSSKETASGWILERGHISIEIGACKAAKHVERPPNHVDPVVFRDTNHVDKIFLAKVLSHIIALFLRRFYNNFVPHGEWILNHKFVELTGNNAISLLALAMDERAADLYIGLLLLDTLIFRVI
jgi:hypothetical protein